MFLILRERRESERGREDTHFRSKWSLRPLWSFPTRSSLEHAHNYSCYNTNICVPEYQWVPSLPYCLLPPEGHVYHQPQRHLFHLLDLSDPREIQKIGRENE